MDKILKLALISFFLVILGGCAVGQMGREMNPSDVKKITRGVTTKQEVVALLGQPGHVSHSGDGSEYWSYTYIQGSHAFGIYGVLLGQGNPYDPNSRNIQTLMITFAGKVVSYYNFSTGGPSGNAGHDPSETYVPAPLNVGDREKLLGGKQITTKKAGSQVPTAVKK